MMQRTHAFRKAIPLNPLTAAARWGGALWYALDRRHRRTACHNVQVALGADADRARDLARANFQHLALVFAEFPFLKIITRENVVHFAECRGLEHIRHSLDRGKGVLILTGHFGNWEWAAYCAGYFLPKRFHVVARHVRPPALNRFINRIREGSGNRVISKKNALRPVLRALRRNEIVAFLLDQNASRANGIFAPFFGGEVLTHRVLALLAVKTGAPVHPAFNWRETSGRYRIEFGPAIAIPEEGSLDERIRKATGRFNRHIESQILRFPEQWFWIHRRFKRFRIPPPA